jgi:4-amino-4-deoxy-L-arabinose transferase-like glycosyltransferase
MTWAAQLSPGMLVKFLRVAGVLALLSWFAVVLFDGLNAGPLFRTESLRALVADEMLRSGNWIVPQCYHAPLLTKPPLAYIAMTLASLPTGAVHEWTARLPSAVAGAITLLLFGWHFRRRLGATAGWMAAAVLVMSLLWLEKVPTAEIESLQVMWVAASLVLLFRALDSEEANAPWRVQQAWWLAALLCVAGGFLTKWTAPAFFYLTAIPLLWWRGRLRLLWQRGHLIATGTAALVCLAWVIAAITQTGSDLLTETLTREALMRLVPTEHDRAYPWLEVAAHPWKMWAAALPWSLVAIVACVPAFGRCLDGAGKRTWQEMHCWIWPNVVFWSLIPEHATRHSFPLLPGIAGLAALVWAAWVQGRLRWPVRRLAPRHIFVAALAIWLTVKLAYVHAVLPPQYHQRGLEDKGAQLAHVVPPSRTVYLFRDEDDSLEGVLFYFSRLRASQTPVPVQRVVSPSELPSSPEPLYCIVDEADWKGGSAAWENCRRHGRAQSVHEFYDERNIPVVVVRVTRD